MLMHVCVDGSVCVQSINEYEEVIWGDGSVCVQSINEYEEGIWGDGRRGVSNAPPDVPRCGFDGGKCPSTSFHLTSACDVHAGYLPRDNPTYSVLYFTLAL